MAPVFVDKRGLSEATGLSLAYIKTRGPEIDGYTRLGHRTVRWELEKALEWMRRHQEGRHG